MAFCGFGEDVDDPDEVIRQMQSNHPPPNEIMPSLYKSMNPPGRQEQLAQRQVRLGEIRRDREMMGEWYDVYDQDYNEDQWWNEWMAHYRSKGKGKGKGKGNQNLAQTMPTHAIAPARASVYQPLGASGYQPLGASGYQPASYGGNTYRASTPAIYPPLSQTVTGAELINAYHGTGNQMTGADLARKNDVRNFLAMHHFTGVNAARTLRTHTGHRVVYPLVVAAELKDVRMVEHLLWAGADPRVINKDLTRPGQPGNRQQVPLKKAGSL